MADLKASSQIGSSDFRMGKGLINAYLLFGTDSPCHFHFLKRKQNCPLFDYVHLVSLGGKDINRVQQWHSIDLPVDTKPTIVSKKPNPI